MSWIVIVRWLFFGLLWPLAFVLTVVYDHPVPKLTLIAFCIAPFGMIVANKSRKSGGSGPTQPPG
ncbi:MAG TPA: hypothetical protein VM452_04370 [Caulifigura sp.]|nr:hypothetical protein [Caulifigura sp.]